MMLNATTLHKGVQAGEGPAVHHGSHPVWPCWPVMRCCRLTLQLLGVCHLHLGTTCTALHRAALHGIVRAACLSAARQGHVAPRSVQPHLTGTALAAPACRPPDQRRQH